MRKNKFRVRGRQMPFGIDGSVADASYISHHSQQEDFGTVSLTMGLPSYLRQQRFRSTKGSDFGKVNLYNGNSKSPILKRTGKF